jgi:hypothetical protein
VLFVADLASLQQAVNYRSLKLAQCLRRCVDAHLGVALLSLGLTAFARDALGFLDPRPFINHR